MTFECFLQSFQSTRKRILLSNQNIYWSRYLSIKLSIRKKIGKRVIIDESIMSLYNNSLKTFQPSLARTSDRLSDRATGSLM